jgi:hypothetical protein
MKTNNENQKNDKLDPFSLMFRQPFSTLTCDICGMPSVLYGIENVPEYARSFVKHDNVMVPNPLGMCIECCAILCHQCSTSGKCSICGNLLFAYCPSTPPSSKDAKIKWNQIYEIEYGIIPKGDVTNNKIEFNKSSITDLESKKIFSKRVINKIPQDKMIIANVMSYSVLFSILQELFGWLSNAQSFGRSAIISLIISIGIFPVILQLSISSLAILKWLAIVIMLSVIIVASPWITGSALVGSPWFTPLSWVTFGFQVLFFIYFIACLSSKKLLENINNQRIAKKN